MRPPKILSVVLLLVVGLLAALALAEVSPKPKANMTAVKVADTTAAAKASQPTSGDASADVIHWVSFDKGVQLQKGTDKHLMVDFTTTWCGWCKKMDREAFSDTTVIHYINKNFVPVKVWADQDSLLDIDGFKITQKDLANSEFNVSGYPTFWFVNTKKEKVGPVPGYMTKDQLMTILPVVAEYRYDTTRTKQNTAPQKAQPGQPTPAPQGK